MAHSSVKKQSPTQLAVSVYSVGSTMPSSTKLFISSIDAAASGVWKVKVPSSAR